MKVDLTNYQDVGEAETESGGENRPNEGLLHALELDVTPRNPYVTVPSPGIPEESQISASLHAYGILVDGVNPLGKQWEENYYCLGGNSAPLDDTTLDNTRTDILGRPVIVFRFSLRNFSRTPHMRILFHMQSGKKTSKDSAVQFFFGSKHEASVPIESSGQSISKEFFPIVPPGEYRRYTAYIRLASDQSSYLDTLFFRKAELLVTNPEGGK